MKGKGGGAELTCVSVETQRFCTACSIHHAHYHHHHHQVVTPPAMSILQMASINAQRTVEERRGKRQISMEFIQDSERRKSCASKRDLGLIKKGVEYSILTKGEILQITRNPETGAIRYFTNLVDVDRWKADIELQIAMGASYVSQYEHTDYARVLHAKSMKAIRQAEGENAATGHRLLQAKHNNQRQQNVDRESQQGSKRSRRKRPGTEIAAANDELAMQQEQQQKKLKQLRSKAYLTTTEPYRGLVYDQPLADGHYMRTVPPTVAATVRWALMLAIWRRR